MRFSKTAMVKHLYDKIDKLEKVHRFDQHNGTAQVENSSKQRNRAYGAYRELLDLCEAIEFDHIK